MGSILTLATDASQWERFQEGRFSAEEIASDPILQRWERCARLGLRADGPAYPLMMPHAELETVAAPLDAPFAAFAAAMAGAGYSGVLADRDGVVVARRCSSELEHTLAETRLLEGARWSEDARGTNAVGTALAEQEAVAVVGAAHFEERNHVLTCYAAPIRDLFGDVIAVLDATGPVSHATPLAHAAVIAAATSMEALLIARAYDRALPGGLLMLERLLGTLGHATFVVEPTGRIRLTNAAFRRLSSTGELGAITPGEISIPGMVAEVEPIGSSERPIAVMVHLLPRRTQRAARDASPAFAPIAGSDPAIAAARERADSFARSSLPVLLLAETGTGKELFARGVHGASERAKEPFIAVNCGALSGALLESELFGYGPGAFTGAHPSGGTGKLAAAHRGTLFLDEVAELSLPAQAMLLRFLEDGGYFRLGESTERRADVRLIAATCRDLSALVAEHRFRTDLYYRIRGVTIRLPALRDRTDRRELVDALLARIAEQQGRPKPLGLSPAALAWIDHHTWPGNVRELKTALEYALVLAADAPRIELSHLPASDADQDPVQPPRDLLDGAERTALMRALDRSGGNMSQAARLMGVARSTLYRMLDRHGLR